MYTIYSFVELHVVVLHLVYLFIFFNCVPGRFSLGKSLFVFLPFSLGIFYPSETVGTIFGKSRQVS